MLKIFPPFKSQEIQLVNYVQFMNRLSEQIVGHENAIEEKVKYKGVIKPNSFSLSPQINNDVFFKTQIVGEINSDLKSMKIGYDTNWLGKALIILGFIFSIVIYLNADHVNESLIWGAMQLLWFPIALYAWGFILHQIQLKKIKKYFIEIVSLNSN